MMLRTLIAAAMLATFSLAATDADARKRSGSSSSSRDKPSTAKKKDDNDEKMQAKKAQQDADAGTTIRINVPRSSTQSPAANQSSLQPAGPSGSALPAAAAMPAGAVAREDEELKRKRAEELAAMQAKLDAQLADRRRTDDVKNAEAAAAAEQRQREQEIARAAQAQREREMRRAKIMSGPPTCVIKPVMSNADLAKCRS